MRFNSITHTHPSLHRRMATSPELETPRTISELKDVLVFFYEELCELCSAETPDAGDPRKLTARQRARERMLSARIDNLDLDGVTCSTERSVAGVGLFACRNFAKDEVITFYPCDALVYLPTNGVVFGSHVPNDLRNPDLCFENSLWLDYSLQEDGEYAVVGIPGLDWDPTYAGHYANDGARLQDGGDASVAAYVLASNSKQNAMHTDIEGLHMVTLATRPIKAGDEILVTYGPDYWFEHDLREDERNQAVGSVATDGESAAGTVGFWDLEGI